MDAAGVGDGMTEDKMGARMRSPEAAKNNVFWAFVGGIRLILWVGRVFSCWWKAFEGRRGRLQCKRIGLLLG